VGRWFTGTIWDGCDAGSVQNAIEVQNLTKDYSGHRVVDGLTFTVPAGSVTGFIGANGAGKTTPMRMLLGLVRPTSGTATVLGHDIGKAVAYLPRVGAMIEGPAFYPLHTGRRNLDILARLAGMTPDVDALLTRVGLAGAEDRMFREYSLGMKQRLGIAAALLTDPAILMLDEPTNGLDPEGIRELRVLFRSLADEGRSLVVSSHLLSELEHVCDHVVMIDHGRLVYDGLVSGLTSRLATTVVAVPEHPADLGALSDLVAMLGCTGSTVDGALVINGDERLPPVLNRAAHARGITLVRLDLQRPSLEQAFFELLNSAKVPT
jgi:ABC-2 type transport system ATP-binding protein